MQRTTPIAGTSRPSRRDLIKAGGAAGAVLATRSIASGAYVAGGDRIRVGLVGCGGRGTGAAVNALTADPGVQLVALADVFSDKLEAALRSLRASEVGDRVRVADGMTFSGFDGYKGVIENCDVVLLATPPHFRPTHLRAAVDAGRHVFCERPVAVDVPGVRKVIEACDVAREKHLTVLSGLAHRYDEAVREAVARVHDGAIGDVTALQGMYNTGGVWTRPRQPGWSDMEWQLRNWRYFTWLGGDHIVEQHVATLDKLLWLMKDRPPATCTANGGRAVRTGPEFGNVYDHFDAIFEWPGGVRAFCQARQWPGSEQDVSDWAFGSRGRAHVTRHTIWDAAGRVAWERENAAVNMYDAEHVALFKSIRDGKPINSGGHMTNATLMGIMGRMAAYTGTTVRWQQLMESTLDLSPPRYEFGPLPTPPVAVPGQTKFT